MAVSGGAPGCERLGDDIRMADVQQPSAVRHQGQTRGGHGAPPQVQTVTDAGAQHVLRADQHGPGGRFSTDGNDPSIRMQHELPGEAVAA